MISKIQTSYLWLAAFLCSLFFINSWQLELFGSAIALVSIWSVVALTQISANGFDIPKSWCLRFMGAFWGLTFISIIGSDITNISVMAFCFFSALPLSFFVLTLNGNRQQFEFIAKILAVVFTGLAIWALIQFVVFNEHFQGRARHPLMNPNSLAALFSLVFFCGLGTVLAAKKHGHKIAGVIFTALIFGGIMATGSRGALFAMLPFVGLLLFFMRGEVRQNWKYILSVFALCLGFFLLSNLGLNEGQNLFNRVVRTVSLSDADISNNRFNLWLATIEMIKAHGLWGTGIGTYFLYFPEFRLPEDRYGAYYAHNDPLQFWVELGVLGPVLFYSFIIAVMGRTIQAVKKTTAPLQKLMILTPFFALAACVLHTHVTFNFYNLSILFSVGFLLSFWFWVTQQVLNTPTKHLQFPPSFTPASRIAAIAFPFILIGGIFMAYIVSEHYNNKARNYLLAGELEEFADDVMLANKISMQGNYRPYLLAVNVPMSILEESGTQLNTAQKQEILDQALEYLNHVRQINPRSASALYYLGKIQQLVPKEILPEDLKSPQFYYEEALRLDPIHIGARIELSYIYERDLLSVERALALIEQGAKYRYATSKAMDLYARQVQLYLKTGDKAGRDKALERMQGFQKFLNSALARQNKPLHAYLRAE